MPTKSQSFVLINGKRGKLLGARIEEKLNFNAHSNDIWKKAG